MARWARTEDPSKSPLSEEQLRALAALEHARQIREELLRWNGGKLFTPTAGEILAELDDEAEAELP